MKIELYKDYFNEDKTIYDVYQTVIENGVLKYYIENEQCRHHKRWVTSELVKRTIYGETDYAKLHYCNSEGVYDALSKIKCTDKNEVILSISELEKIFNCKIQIVR